MSPRRERLLLLTIAAVWLVFCVVTVRYQVAFPGPDVFQFKGPGIYFAQHGLLGGINMPFSPPNVPSVYAFYPPVYAFVFGLWCTVAGVSLQSSTVFELVVHAVRALMVGALVWPSMKRSGGRGRVFVAATLVLLSLAPNNEDRPDELGLIFGLASWWVLMRGRSAVVAGVLLGLSGATSPAAGLFSAIGVVFVCRRRDDVWKATFTAAAASVLAAAATVVPIVMADATAIDRFMVGVRFNAVPYGQLAPTAVSMIETVRQILHNDLVYLKHSIPLLPLLLALTGLTAWLWTLADAGTRRHVFPGIATAAVFLPITLLVFPKEPLYFWFSGVGLLIAVLVMTLHQARYRVVSIAMVGGMAVFLGREGKMIADGLTRAPEQTLESVQTRLLNQVAPSARIAGWPDSLFTLAGVRPFESLQFSCKVLDTYDYLFLTDGATFPTAAARALPVDVALRCGHPAAACFTVQDDIRGTQPVSLVGWRPGPLVRGFGGVLFRRTGC